MKTFLKAGSLLITLSVCFGYLGYASYAGALTSGDKAALPPLSSAQLTRAKQLFKERCAKCHGTNGRGQTVVGDMLDVPNYTDKAWWAGDVEDKRLIKSVRNGKGGMPKFGKKLTGQQIVLLVTYLRRFEKSSR